MAQQYNYNWNVSSPYQNGQISANYFYPPVSPAINHSYYNNFDMNQYFPLNASFTGTPNSDNRTFSSGYGSESTSFNSPPVQKLNYGLYPNNLQNQQSTPTEIVKNKGNKRSRDEVESLSICNPDLIFKDIMQEPSAKKTKKVYQKKEPVQTMPLEQFEDEFDENDFDLNFDNSQLDQFGEKKKRVLTRSQRIAANLRERKRMGIMNDSFVKLRESLPITTGRKRRKMSRLDIVVGAMEYIAYLEQLLEKDVPGEIDFDSYQNSLYLL